MMRHVRECGERIAPIKAIRAAREAKARLHKICKKILKPADDHPAFCTNDVSDFVMPPLHERSSGHDEPGFDDASGHSSRSGTSSIPAKLGLGTGAGGARRLAVLRPADRAIADALCDRDRLARRCSSIMHALDRDAPDRRAILVAGLVPAIEELNTLSFLILVVALAHRTAAHDQSGNDRASPTAPRAAQLCPDRALQVLPRRRFRSSTCRRSPAASHSGCCRRCSAPSSSPCSPRPIR